MESLIPIGTCRIANPLNFASAIFPFQLNAKRTYGFVHGTREILQQIRYAAGELAMPQALWPFLSARSYVGTVDAGLPVPTRSVVEISVLGSLVFEGYFLQRNRFAARFRHAPQCLRLFFRAPPSERLPLLREIPEYHQLDEMDRRVLAETQAQAQSYDELAAEIDSIADMLPAGSLFVTPCNARDATGQWLKDRARAVKYVQRICQRRGLACFDPSLLLAEYGQNAGLAKDGADLDHYSEAFCKVVGEALGRVLYGAQRRARAAPTALDPADWRAALNAARQAGRDGDWERAGAASALVLAAAPDNSAALLLRARALLNLDAPAEAIRVALRALAACATEDSARLLEAMRGAESISDFELALQFGLAVQALAGVAKAGVSVARYQLRLGDPEAALVTLRALGRAAPAQLEAFISEAFRNDDALPAAVAARAAGLELLPQHALWRTTVMDRLLRLARQSRLEAEHIRETELLRAALLLDPDCANTRKAVRVACREVLLRLREAPDRVQQARMERLLTLPTGETALLAAHASSIAAAPCV